MNKTNTFFFIIILFSVAFQMYSQEAMMIDPEGNVGIGTSTPQARLDVNGNVVINGQLLRRVQIATGLGPDDQTDNGQITSRVLTFTKLFDDTAVKITYCDNFRVSTDSSNFGTGQWEIMIDGSTISGGALIYQIHASSASNYHNYHLPATLVGYAEGIEAGNHEIQVWVQSPVPGHPGSGDLYTGWRNSRWTIEAEEVWVE